MFRCGSQHNSGSQGAIVGFLLDLCLRGLLIHADRPERAIWEVERLIRKVLLSPIANVLPVTLSPANPMEAVTLVSIASLVAMTGTVQTSGF